MRFFKFLTGFYQQMLQQFSEVFPTVLPEAALWILPGVSQRCFRKFLRELYQKIFRELLQKSSQSFFGNAHGRFLGIFTEDFWKFQRGLTQESALRNLYVIPCRSSFGSCSWKSWNLGGSFRGIPGKTRWQRQGGVYERISGEICGDISKGIFGEIPDRTPGRLPFETRGGIPAGTSGGSLGGTQKKSQVEL